VSDLSRILAGMLELMSPPHEVEAAAVRGGPVIGKLILRLYEMALEAEPIALSVEAQLEFLAWEPGEEEIAEFVAEQPR
jgi:hypothetical protein